MKMDENLKDAVETIEFYFRDAPSGDARDWQTIRSRLVELEAENERLRESTHHANGVADLAMKHRDDAELRSNKAEVLLLDASRYLDPRHYSEIIKRITAHLSENGHG